MKCPKCKNKALCVDTATSGVLTYRKYKCTVCGEKVYTTEREDRFAHNRLNNIRLNKRKRNALSKTKGVPSEEVSDVPED